MRSHLCVMEAAPRPLPRNNHAATTSVFRGSLQPHHARRWCADEQRRGLRSSPCVSRRQQMVADDCSRERHRQRRISRFLVYVLKSHSSSRFRIYHPWTLASPAQDDRRPHLARRQSLLRSHSLASTATIAEHGDHLGTSECERTLRPPKRGCADKDTRATLSAQ